ncbi:MAG: hypothetical protein AABO41_23955 [Acidobacteriota bacterium]
MYCPNCGAESTFGLNYCKHCGGNLSETSQTTGPPANRNTVAALILAAATVAIVLGGLGIVLTSALALVGPQPQGYSPPVNEAAKLGFMMVGFGCSGVVLVALMLIRLFSRVMGFGPEIEKPSKRAKNAAQQRVPQIQAPPLVVSSVTEHTTRNFDPRVYQRDTSE